MEIQSSRTWNYYSRSENIIELINKTNMFIDPITTRKYKIEMFNVTTRDWKKTVFVIVDISTSVEYYSIVNCVYTYTPKFSSGDSNISVDATGIPVCYISKNRGNNTNFQLLRYSRHNLERNQNHRQESSFEGTPSRRTVRFEDSVDRVNHCSCSELGRRYHPEMDMGYLLENIKKIIAEEVERLTKRSTGGLLSSKSSIVIEGYHREGVHLDIVEYFEKIKNQSIRSSPFNFLDVENSRIHDHSLYGRTLSLSLPDQNSLQQIRKECQKVDTLIFLSRDKNSSSDLVKEIIKFADLKHLCLVDFHCPGGIFFYDLSELKSLETLHLREVTINSPIKTLVVLENVKVMTIHDCRFCKFFSGNDDDREQLTLGNFPSNVVVIRFFSSIYQWSIKDERVPVLERSEDLRSLKKSIKALHVDGLQDLVSICDIGNFPNLERIYIDRCHNVEFRTEDIEKFARLKVIHFINCFQESLLVDVDLDLLIERGVRVVVVQCTVNGLGLVD